MLNQTDVYNLHNMAPTIPAGWKSRQFPYWNKEKGEEIQWPVHRIICC